MKCYEAEVENEIEMRWVSVLRRILENVQIPWKTNRNYGKLIIVDKLVNVGKLNRISENWSDFVENWSDG